MAEVSILHIERIRARAGGAFALFSFDLGPFRMIGCTLVQKPDGELDMYPPRSRAPGACVMVRDHGVRDDVVRAACAAYVAIGGRLPTE